MRLLSYAPTAAILWFAVAATPAAAAHPEDAKINRVYAQLAAARAANDLDGMVRAFGPEGLLVDSRPGPAISGSELGGRLKPMVERVKAEGVKIGTAYRLERRSVNGDIALDAGYMRQTIARPGGETMTRYARFLVTLQRDASGAWRIIGDASMPAEQAAFDAVTRIDGLHYDS